MIYIGIDNGLQGAVGIINPDHSEFNMAIDTPIFEVKKGKKIKHKFAVSEMVKILNIKNPSDYFCILEQAQAMPGQGVVAMFSTGLGFGIWQGILSTLSIPYEVVHPRVWQKEFFSSGLTKGKSVEVAQRLFPTLQFTTPRGRRLDGRADAILMAEYGKRLKERK